MSEGNAYGPPSTKVVGYFKWIIDWTADLAANWPLQYPVWLMIFPLFPGEVKHTSISFVVVATLRSDVTF